MKRMVLCLWLAAVVSAGAVEWMPIDKKVILVPTATPTATPTPVVWKVVPRVSPNFKIIPTATPTATLTPTPTVTITTTPTVTPMVTTAVTTSPTPTTGAERNSQDLTNIFLVVTVGLLVIILLVQNWPKNKEDNEEEN